MNLLIVTPFFAPQTGGVSTYLEDLRRSLSSRGHQVLVLVPGDSHSISPRVVDNDERVFEFFMRTLWYPRTPVKGFIACLVHFFPTLLKLLVFVRRHRIDLVSLEYPVSYMFYFYILRAFCSIKICIGLHGSDVNMLHLAPKHEQWIVRGMIRRAQWVLAHSSSLMKETERVVGGLSGNRSYLPYWVECDRLRERAKAKTESKCLPPGPFILTAAKLYSRKALDVLLRAISELGQAAEGYRFVIAGEGPEEFPLKQMAEKLKIQEFVEFVGDIPNEDMPVWFQQCEFFVLPSRSEPFGIVLLEAMTFAKAIVATRVGGIPEFVTDGYNGLLVPPEDSGALAEKIRMLLFDQELRSRIGRNGLERVEKEFDAKAMIGKYEALFRMIVNADMVE